MGNVTDALVRRIVFGYSDFFEKVRIRDATRSPYYLEDSIELPRYHYAPYFLEGEDVQLLVEDGTVNRLEKEKFSISTNAILTYRKDSEDIFTITIGSREDGYDRNEIRIIEEITKKSFCGQYLIKLTTPLPEGIASFMETQLTNAF